MSSSFAKPVNMFAFFRALEAPRYARTSRSRYMPCSENVLTLMKNAMNQPRTYSATASASASEKWVRSRTSSCSRQCTGLVSLAATGLRTSYQRRSAGSALATFFVAPTATSGNDCTFVSSMLVAIDSAMARSTRKTAGAALTTIAAMPCPAPDFAVPPADLVAISEAPNALTHPLSTPRAASAWGTPVFQGTANSHPGATRTAPHTTSQTRQNINMMPLLRDIHSRSSSARKRLLMPTKRTIPVSTHKTINGGVRVTATAHEGAAAGSGLSTR